MQARGYSRRSDACRALARRAVVSSAKAKLSLCSPSRAKRSSSAVAAAAASAAAIATRDSGPSTMGHLGHAVVFDAIEQATGALLADLEHRHCAGALPEGSELIHGLAIEPRAVTVQDALVNLAPARSFRIVLGRRVVNVLEQFLGHFADRRPVAPLLVEV